MWVLKGFGETFLCSLAETVSRFPSGRGHHFPAPTWEGCRATLKTLLSCSALLAGGCRSSGWTLVLLAVVLLALVLFAGLWVRGFFFVAPSQRPVFFRRYPLDVLGLCLPASEASRVGGPLVVSVVTDQMVGDRRSLGRQYWVSRPSTSSANHHLPAPPTGPVHRDGSFFLCFVTGASVFWDFGSLCPKASRRPSGQLLRQRQSQRKTLRRPGRRLLRQRHQRNDVATSLKPAVAAEAICKRNGVVASVADCCGSGFHVVKTLRRP